MIVRPGGLGDLVLLTKALQEYDVSQVEILWLIERRSEPWAREIGLRYICYDDIKTFPALLVALATWAPRCIINSEQKYGLSQVIVELARRRNTVTIGFATNESCDFFIHSVPYDHRDSSELIEFGKLFKVLCELSSFCSHRGVSWTNFETENVDKQVPVVVISGLHSISRTLSDETWQKFIQDQLGKNSFRVLAGPLEAKLANELSMKFPSQALYEPMSFHQVCDEIRKCSRFYGLDGGLVHVASYFGTPATVLFTNGNYKKWGPLAAGSQILRRRDLSCQPCTIFGTTPPCSINYLCREISRPDLSV
jgi:hypothetical protein